MEYEEMYKAFKLESESVEHLNRLSSKNYPFDEQSIEFSLKTVVSDGINKYEIYEERTDAELV